MADAQQSGRFDDDPDLISAAFGALERADAQQSGRFDDDPDLISAAFGALERMGGVVAPSRAGASAEAHSR